MLQTSRRSLLPLLETRAALQDEANVGRLGLICAQERVPDDYVKWQATYSWEGLEAEISCKAARDDTVPHGIDGDFATVLNLLYIEQGSPAHGWISTTAHHLIQRAGFANTGFYYARLRESLERLKGSQYVVHRGWQGGAGEQFRAVHFSYVAEFNTESRKRELGEQTLLKILLAEPIRTSIRQGYLQPLDMDFLVSLSGTTTRAVFRLLSAVRQQLASLESEYVVNLSVWAKACKLVECDEAFRVKRLLGGAHRELLERGFLRDVQYQGRGQRCQIVYTFADALVLPPAAPTQAATLPLSPLLDDLKAQGFGNPAAQKLLAQHAEEKVRGALKGLAHLIRGGFQPKSRAAVLRDLLSNPDKYQFPPLVEVQPSVEPRAAAVTLHKARLRTSQTPEPDPLDEETQFRAMPLEGQAHQLCARLKVVLGKAFQERWRARLSAGVLVGELDAWTVMTGAIRTVCALRSKEVVEQLEAL